MTMAKNVKQMIEAANAVVPHITAQQAQDLMANANVLVIDVREVTEIKKSGKITGAIHISRGMLEFRADPDTPYYDKKLTKDKVLIVYCASGGRSALSGKVLKDMGYSEVFNLGSFNDWAKNGGAVERLTDPDTN